MDKFANKIYAKSDAFFKRYQIQKDKICSGLQGKMSQDKYVPMEGHICLERLENGRYENHDVFCNVCHVYKHNGSKRLRSDLSQDIFVPLDVFYIFMSRLAAKGTYENGDVFCYIYNLEKDNDCKRQQRNVSEDVYVSTDSFNRCFDENSINNPSQMLAPLVPTDTNKPIEYIRVKSNIYQKEIVKKRKNFAKKEECQIKIKKPTHNEKLRPLSEGFNQILSLESSPKNTRIRYSEIYDVPNSPPPTIPIETQHYKEFIFRLRSNACVSQNKRTYLKEAKSACT